MPCYWIRVILYSQTGRWRFCGKLSYSFSFARNETGKTCCDRTCLVINIMEKFKRPCSWSFLPAAAFFDNSISLSTNNNGGGLRYIGLVHSIALVFYLMIGVWGMLLGRLITFLIFRESCWMYPGSLNCNCGQKNIQNGIH